MWGGWKGGQVLLGLLGGVIKDEQKKGKDQERDGKEAHCKAGERLMEKKRCQQTSTGGQIWWK